MTRRRLPRRWIVSFTIRPQGKRSGLSNIIHATRGGSSAGQHGYHTPSVWFLSNSRRLRVCSTVSNNPNYCYNSPTSLPDKQNSRVVIQQIRRSDGKYFYRIYINGHLRVNVQNTNPQIFYNVKYWISNPWNNEPSTAFIRRFNLRVYDY